MLTVQAIKNRARNSTSFHGHAGYFSLHPNGHGGCFRLDPPVKLRCTVDVYVGISIAIKEGEIVHTDAVDESFEESSYQRPVHLQEKGYWWDIGSFELAD